MTTMRGYISTTLKHQFIVLLMLLSLAEKAVWVYLHKNMPNSGEAFNVAKSIALGHGFSDALGNGLPTAHLTPSMVVIAGTIYSLFGVRANVSEIILFACAYFLVCWSYLNVYIIFRKLQLPDWAALLSLAFVLLAPIYTTIESIDFRLWEGGLALALATFALLNILNFDRSNMNKSAIVWLTLLFAAIFLFSPTIGLSVYAVWGLFIWNNRKENSLLVPSFITAIMLVLVLLPWCIRNFIEFGRFIPTRDNIGMEMSLSYYEGVNTIPDNLITYWDRLHLVHPYNSSSAFRKMQNMGGEIPYNDFLKASAVGWIASHPIAFLTILANHIREFIFPSKWQFPVPELNILGYARWITVNLISFLGLFGLALSVTSTKSPYFKPVLYVSCFTVMIPVSYAIVHPIPRYMWLSYPFLVFWSAFFIHKIRINFGKNHGSVRVSHPMG